MKTVRKIPNFPGTFRTWTCTYNINREKSRAHRFVVFSSGKRQKVLNHLWLKLVWDELSQIEFLLFINCPEILSNNKIVGFLRTRLKFDKKILRKRLIQMEKLIGEKPSTRERYNGTKRISIDIQMEEISLRPTKKFSGYVRNISSIGRSKGGAVLPEPIFEDYVEDIEPIDWYDILSVGEFTLLSQRIVLPEEDQ